MQNQHRGLFRRGLLQKIRPFALTNAAIAKLKHPHKIENNTWRESDRACCNNMVAKENPAKTNDIARGREATDSRLLF